MTEKHDIRRHTRIAQSTPVQLAWVDASGTPRAENARCVDVSESGMRIETSASIEKGTLVALQARALLLHGSSTVRSCMRRGNTYVLGLTFVGGLKWKPKV